MSLASWKKEFYRTPANKVSQRYALKHSIKKWVGLLSKNRRKHKVILESGILFDNTHNELYIGSESCALCERYCDEEGFCGNCPLSFVINSSDNPSDNPCGDAYCAMFKNKVAPMINLLKRAEIEVRKRKEKKNESCC